jgi:hypothetical protein
LNSQIRAFAGTWRRRIVLRRAIRRLRRFPRGTPEIWADLLRGWGNKDYAARPTYLDAVAAAALAQPGPVLECGSGLTTLVLATIAERSGSAVWSLEHERDWYVNVRSALDRQRLSADLLCTPLRSYGDFDWYDVDPAELPMFGLVICDGPPESTRGGRYGLLPVLGERLAPGCTILLDDAGRSGERAALAQWSSEAKVDVEVRGGADPYAIVRL